MTAQTQAAKLTSGFFQETNLLEAERRLAEDIPFGCASHNLEAISDVYENLLRSIAKASAAAGDLLDVISNNDRESRLLILRDPLTRRTIEDGVCRTVMGIDTIESATLDALLSSAAKHAGSPGHTMLDKAVQCAPVYNKSGELFVWKDNNFGSFEGQYFEQEILGRVDGIPAMLF